MSTLCSVHLTIRDRLESENAGMDRDTLDRVSHDDTVHQANSVAQLQEVQLLMVEIGIKLAHAEQLGKPFKLAILTG